MVSLSTDRLFLREQTPEDAPFILELVNDPAWIQYIGDRGVRSEESAKTYIRDGAMASYAQHGFGLWLVAQKTDDVPVGICGLIKRDNLEDVDIGFAFLPQYRGKGYAYESASAVLNYGLEELGIQRIIAITTPDNVRSQGLLEKIGLQFERTFQFGESGEELCLFGTKPSTSAS
ncbi:MAG: GNAT family N-acetyltransferase [Bacteroidota bacterium]